MKLTQKQITKRINRIISVIDKISERDTLNINLSELLLFSELFNKKFCVEYLADFVNSAYNIIYDYSLDYCDDDDSVNVQNTIQSLANQLFMID